MKDDANCNLVFFALQAFKKMSVAKLMITLRISVAIVYGFRLCIEKDWPLSKSS